MLAFQAVKRVGAVTTLTISLGRPDRRSMSSPYTDQSPSRPEDVLEVTRGGLEHCCFPSLDIVPPTTGALSLN